MTDTERHERLYSIFSEACEMPPSERTAFLDRACRGDSKLRSEVEDLLRIDKSENSGDWELKGAALEHASALILASDGPNSVPMPECIGPYRLIEMVGEGGMGMVYRAEQENPRRYVALKVIRPGAVSQRMLKRFELEAQTLGRLHHHGIAQIYEAGTFNSGAGLQPFFAMEYLDGKPLLEYTNDNNLSVHDRLELLIRICEAVEHAHSKCVIHRDLKPVNIIVEGGDANRTPLTNDSADLLGQPKILDFGVARVTDSDIQATTIGTDVGQLVGTLPYMSPEQVGGQPDDLDTRSDVYALGVIGYELLAGRRPHELAGKSLPEAVRIIREENPAPLGRINRNYRGDLETIIGKATEKEKSRRYQSAREIAEDIRRYLRNEPIVARPPSALYHIRKFVQRNRAMVSGMLVAVIAIMVGVFGAVWAQAERQAYLETADMYKSQLRRILETRPGEDPLRPQEVDREWLNEAAIFVDRRLSREPLEAAVLRNLIGLNFLKLDLYHDAHQQLARALATRRAHLRQPHAELAESLHNMGRVLWHMDEFTEAESLYRESLAMRRELYGEKHPDVAETMTHVAACLRDRGEFDAAHELYRHALNMRYELQASCDGPCDDIAADIAANYNNMAVGMQSQGRFEVAAELFQKALDIIMAIAADPDDLRIARGKRWLGACLTRLGRFEEAEVLLNESMLVHTRVLGMNNRYFASVLYELARFNQARGELSVATETAESSLAIQRRVLGHQLETSSTLELLGNLYLQQGEPQRAIESLWSALLIRKDRRHPDHPDLDRTRKLLVQAAQAVGDPQIVETLLRSSEADWPVTATEATEELDWLLDLIHQTKPMAVGGWPNANFSRVEWSAPRLNFQW